MCVSPGRKAAWTRKRGALARERRRLGKKEGVGLRAGACDWRLAERERGRGRKAAQVLFSGLRAAATAFPFFFLGKCCFLVQKVCKNGSIGLVLSFACAVSGARANPAQEQLVEEAHVARDIGAVQVEVGVKGAKRLVVVL